MSTVLVTGANRGIGFELARQYADAGWQVHACSRSGSVQLDELVDSFNDAVSAHLLDVSDHEAIENLASTLEGVPIDVLINNAGRYGKIPLSNGGGVDQSFGHSDYEDWIDTIRVNVFGPMKMSEAFIDNIAASEQKKIAHITSFLGSSTLNTQAASGDFAGGLYAYRTSKTSVNIIARSMAVDLEARGVTVIAIHPGWVKTDMGGPDAQVEVPNSVAIDDSGRLTTFDGEVLPS